MKWNEVRKQFRTFSKKAMAGVITASLIGSSIAGCGAEDLAVSMEETADGQKQGAEESKQDAQVDALLDTLQENTNRSNVEQGKEETVYIFADSEGNMTSTVVSGWLKNPEGLDVLTDTTNLTDVVNVKGDEGFEKSGDEYRWDAKGNDIYYQGTTTKEAPVKEKITYYLDGKEISAKELAGKSGQVKIRIDYENTQTVTAVVNGKEEEVCVPFAVVTGMILNDRFRNIEVENGRLVSDGKNNIVIGFALPGLKESLKLDEQDLEKEIKVPQYVEVSADVEDFALDMTLTVASSSADLSFDEALDFSDLDEKIDTLTDSSSQLADGTGELSDGIKTLKDSMGEFSDGVSALKDGIADYTDGAGQLADGIVEVKDGAGSLDDGAGELVDGIGTLQDGAVTLKDGIGTAENGAKQLKDGIDSAQSGAKELKAGIGTAAEGAAALKSGIDSAKAGADQLAAGINGAGGAKSGTAQLAAGAAALKAGFDGTENDPANPGAVLASKQIAFGVKQIVAVIQESAAKIQGVEGQLLDAEVIYVQKLYEAAGMGNTVSRDTVRAQAQNIGPVVNGIIGGIQSQVADAMNGIVTSAAENAAEEAASAAKEQGYRQGLEEAAANMDEALAKEALLKQESEAKKQDGEGASVTESTASLEGQNENAGTANEGKNDNASSDDAEGVTGGADQNSPAEENQPVETSGSRQENGDASSDGQQENGGQSSDGQQESGGPSADTSDAQGTEPAEVQPEAAAEPAAESDDSADVNESAGSGQDGLDDSIGEYYDNETGNLEAVMTQALSAASEKILTVGKAAGAIEAIETMLNQLESAGGQISAEQMELIQSLVDGADALAAGMDQLSAGADQLYAGAAQLDAGMNALGSGAKSLTDGMNQLSVGGSTLTEGMSKLNAGSSELTEGMGKLSSGSSSLTDGMGQLKSGSQELTDGVSRLYDGSVTLKDGTQQLRSGAVKLEDGAAELTGHSGELLDGADELAEGTQKVVDGVDELYDGARTLLDGMLEFDREGIQKIADAYNGDVKSLTDRVKAISDAGSSYDNFCGRSEEGSSSVKFIIRTEPVKAEE